MASTYQMTEDAISDAIIALNERFYSTPIEAAKAYNVAPCTVQQRLQGMGSQSSRTPPNRALNPQQEQAIRNYLKRLDDAGISATLFMLRGAANHLLKRSHFDPCTLLPTISSCWPRQFLNRNKEFFKKKQKPLAIDQKDAHNIKDFTIYFEKYKEIRIQRGITDANVWNMDETGFCIGCEVVHWVITMDIEKKLLLSDPDNKEFLTACESISGGRVEIQPMLILSSALILEKWVQENDLDGEILLSTSPTDYSNDELAFKWLQHFERHSHKTQIGVWRLLILDGYGSHLTYEFYEYAQKHKIELFALPPHSTHLTQPRDVGCFQPYKYYHSEAIDETMRIGIPECGKLDFLASLTTMRAKTFKESTILSAFRKTGLIPYKPEIVLQKIRSANSQTPPSQPVTPPPLANLFSGICNKTPRRCEQVVGQARTLLNTIQQDERLVHRKFWPHLERFICGSLTSAFTHYLFDRDLNATYKEAAARAAQKKLTGRVAQKGRVVTVREIRGKITKRAEDEVEKARNALRRAEIAAEKKEKAEINAQKRTKKALFKEVKAYLKARPQLAKSLT